MDGFGSKRVQKVTLQTIADAAGLSKFAVSRALSGKPGVSDLTRDRVNRIANKLGYQARNARTAPTLAVLCEDAELINGELNQKIMSGVRDEAHKIGFELIELHTTGVRQLSDVAERAHGLIFVGVNQPEAYREAARFGVPMVKIGTFEPLEQFDIVRGTNYESGRVVGDLFLEHGHTHVVYVRGRRDFRGRRERFNGFFAAAHHDQGAKVSDLRWESESDLQTKLDELLQSSDPATGFFCAHDGIAVTIMSELLSRNLRIPGDVSVVGYGDYIAAQHIRPPLTTVSVPGFAFGREAVRLIKDRLSDPTSKKYSLRVQIPSEVIMRETLGERRAIA